MTTWYKSMCECLIIQEEPSLQPQLKLAVGAGSPTGGTGPHLVALLWGGLPVVLTVNMSTSCVDPGLTGLGVAGGVYVLWGRGQEVKPRTMFNLSPLYMQTLHYLVLHYPDPKL